MEKRWVDIHTCEVMIGWKKDIAMCQSAVNKVETSTQCNEGNVTKSMSRKISSCVICFVEFKFLKYHMTRYFACTHINEQ